MVANQLNMAIFLRDNFDIDPTNHRIHAKVIGQNFGIKRQVLIGFLAENHPQNEDKETLFLYLVYKRNPHLPNHFVRKILW